MTRDEAIKVVQDYILANETHPDRFLIRYAFDDCSPMRGALMMLEALGLVKFDDSPTS